MNLEKLFETQKVLRERINYQGEDRFNKLILALLVELGECANEWRGFKFWSKNQNPNTHEEEWEYAPGDHGPRPVFKNPLLEEYVDCLHFILELGIEHGIYELETIDMVEEQTVTDSFLSVMEYANNFDLEPTKLNFTYMFEKFKKLGKQLGFTWKQVEQAYYDKNKVNHERQDNGY